MVCGHLARSDAPTMAMVEALKMGLGDRNTGFSLIFLCGDIRCFPYPCQPDARGMTRPNRTLRPQGPQGPGLPGDDPLRYSCPHRSSGRSSMRGPHDVGGLEAGPVDTTTHDMSFWEKQIDALHALVGDEKRGIVPKGQNRRYVEALGEDVYNTLNYYERWTATMSQQLLEKGILTRDEIDAKVKEIRDRLEATGELELGQGEAEKI
ncbi:MAG: nitrile hydratase subunit beta [Alphaproteobacteria bacterium]|nr:MAG: nitrile hydratase subunit beta [Alphaproteobacteria bacterium]